MRRFIRRGVSVLSVVAVAVAGAYFVLIYVPEPPVPALGGSLTRTSVRVGDRERSFAYYAPSPLPAHAPLLIALHGAGQTGEEFRWHTGYGFDRLADAEGMVVAYPEGYEHRWNDCRKAGSFAARTLNIDDVGFIRALIADLRSKLGIDPERVFATGHSNGGQMTYRLALEMPDELRGVAPISAGLPTEDERSCQPSGKPVSVLVMNGTDDPFNPYGGGRKTIFGFGDRGAVRSSVDSARYFAGLAGLSAAPAVERLPGEDGALWVERSTWGAPGGKQVVLDTIHGGGHVVPQGVVRYPRLLGKTDSAFDGPAEIVRFFMRQAR
jgi:polyhydroxybutyrate depolymerase